MCNMMTMTVYAAGPLHLDAIRETAEQLAGLLAEIDGDQRDAVDAGLTADLLLRPYEERELLAFLERVREEMNEWASRAARYAERAVAAVDDPMR